MAGNFFLIVYLVGAALGLVWTDARPLTRLALALLWPLGPAAFVVTLGVLLMASLIAFPVAAAIVVGVAMVLRTIAC
jgi:hypothetical protein